jgi:ribose transport system substrate-binding protein
MTMNNRILICMLAFFAIVLGLIKLCQTGGRKSVARQGAADGRSLSDRARIVMYLPMPHPYCTEVGEGAQAFSDKFKVPVLVKTGQDAIQANVNQNVESLSTMGYDAFSIYPVDPAGSKGLFAQLRRKGKLVVCYGAQPAEGTQASFCIATDTRNAAGTAAEHLIRLMGGKGRILNVLEGMTDANTPVRKAAIEAAVARHPGVQVIQTIGDATTEQKAQEKIESALVARGEEIDGVICTGYTTTAAAGTLLSERNSKPGAKYIHFVGLDTDDRVIKAIRDGKIDATIAQNPYGHGYLTCLILDLMLKGWSPVKDYQFIDSGGVVITRDNVDRFKDDVKRNTERIESDIKARYLVPPAGGGKG